MKREKNVYFKVMLKSKHVLRFLKGIVRIGHPYPVLLIYKSIPSIAPYQWHAQGDTNYLQLEISSSWLDAGTFPGCLDNESESCWVLLPCGCKSDYIPGMAVHLLPQSYWLCESPGCSPYSAFPEDGCWFPPSLQRGGTACSWVPQLSPCLSLQQHKIHTCSKTSGDLSWWNSGMFCSLIFTGSCFIFAPA